MNKNEDDEHQLHFQDYADCSLEVKCGMYTDVSFDTSGLTSSVTQSDFTLSTEDVSSLTTDISCKSTINNTLCTKYILTIFSKH